MFVSKRPENCEKVKSLASALALALLWPSGVALGQGTGGVSEAPTIDRDRTDRQAPQILEPKEDVESPEVRVEVAAQAGRADAIKLTRVRYEGATLSAGELERATAPFIGRPLSQENLQKIANAISAAYRASDIAFFGVSIPAQSPKGGELTVRVLEGHIAHYALASESPSMPTRLMARQAQRLMDDKPTHKSTLERTLSLLRDIPGQTVQAQVQPTKVPGELALGLDVERKQLELTFNVNNRGITNVTDGVQMQVAVGVNGLLREGDSTRASAYLPFQADRYQHYTLRHSTPLGSNGTQISFSGAYVRTLTQVFHIRGEAKQAGVTLSHPIIRSYKRNLSASLSLDGTDSDNYFLDTQFGGFKTRAVRLSLSWSSLGTKGGYAVAASLSQGLDGLGAAPFEGYSQPDFRKANMQINVAQRIGGRMSARLGLKGQYSDSLLPTTERSSLGGAGSGLAFRQGVVTADSAVSGNLEMSYKVFGPARGTSGLSLFGFVDGALGRSDARPVYALEKRDYSLASAGGGVRLSPLKGWVGSAQLAVPLKHPTANTRDKARFIFSISKAM